MTCENRCLAELCSRASLSASKRECLDHLGNYRFRYIDKQNILGVLGCAQRLCKPVLGKSGETLLGTFSSVRSDTIFLSEYIRDFGHEPHAWIWGTTA
jgi:hypothetical protein